MNCYCENPSATPVVLDGITYCETLETVSPSCMPKSCPDGYWYNDKDNMCQTTYYTDTLCPDGYNYNVEDKTCTCETDVFAEPQTIFSGETTTIELTSTLPGVTYSWIVSQTNVTGAIAGTGNTISQTLNSTSGGTVSYIITPYLEGSCTGQSIQVVVTIRPCTVNFEVTNLNVDTYRDGTAIPHVVNQTTWQGLTTGAWCYYGHNAANGPIYGKLYNWYAVAGIHDLASLTDPSLRKNLAPAGYHVPTKAEWETEINCLGGAFVAGGKMKETGTTHWISPNTGATNESGFTGLPGGVCAVNQTFGTQGYTGSWFSITESGALKAYQLRLSSSSSLADLDDGASKNQGLSVRLIQD
jgi:uncharacterized protein (TIGR02145 family)